MSQFNAVRLGFISLPFGFTTRSSSVHQIDKIKSRFFCPRIGGRRIHNQQGSYKQQLLPTMVFTGIVEEMGTVDNIENLQSDDGGVNLTVSADVTTKGVKEGDSISVNGTCLTVTNILQEGFTFGLAPETLRRTNLGALRSGSKVNLERSLGTDGRFGGHVVQGHVDCTGTIMSITDEKDATWFKIQIPQEYMKLVVEKGYVAVDGTSLTVCNVHDDENCFTFMMIPYTKDHVVVASKNEGDMVNIEFDIVGKYVERIIAPRLVTI